MLYAGTKGLVGWAGAKNHWDDEIGREEIQGKHVSWSSHPNPEAGLQAVRLWGVKYTGCLCSSLPGKNANSASYCPSPAPQLHCFLGDTHSEGGRGKVGRVEGAV